MAETVGSNDYMAIALEGTVGSTVKASVYLDLMSSSYGQNVELSFRRSFRQEGRFRKRAIPKVSDITGDVEFEVTADKITKILAAAFGLPETSGGGIPYTHVFKNPVAITGNKSLTVVQSMYGYPRISTGAQIGKLEFRASVDNPLTCLMTLGAVDMAYQGTSFDMTKWTNSPAYDAQGSYEDFHCLVNLNGAVVDTVEDVTVSVDLAPRPKRVLLATRRPISHLNGVSTVQVRATLWFTSDAQRYKLLGNTGAVSYPFKVTAAEPPAQTLLFKAVKGNREFQIDIADMRITESGDVEYTDDVVKQSVTFEALYHATPATDIVVTVKNGETTVVADSTSVSGADLPSTFGASTTSTQRI